MNKYGCLNVNDCQLKYIDIWTVWQETGMAKYTAIKMKGKRLNIKILSRNPVLLNYSKKIIALVILCTQHINHQVYIKMDCVWVAIGGILLFLSFILTPFWKKKWCYKNIYQRKQILDKA